MMADEYDEATARHYVAYRPPLHERILRPMLKHLPHFASALDIGCGAGHSTVALASFAEKLTGTDPSQHMTAAAAERWEMQALFVSDAPHPISKTFQHDRFDLFSLAGVLPYCDRAETLDQLFRIAGPEARVVVYDFDVELSALHDRLGYIPANSAYRHNLELPEHDRYGFSRQLKIRNELSFVATSSELAHLLLSVRDFRLWAEGRLGEEATHARLSARLGEERHRLKARTYCSLFAF